MKSNFDYANDIERANYLLYKNKLINYRTYDCCTRFNVKILLPLNIDIKEMIRKNRILKNRTDFNEYRLNLKDHRFIEGIDYLLGLNKAISICEERYQISRSRLLAAVSIFSFQVFSRQDALDILYQNNFVRPSRFFTYLFKKEFIIRVDNLKEKTSLSKRLYTMTDKGVDMIKDFYNTVEGSSVSGFKFKNKSETIVDDLLRKYE